MRRAGIAVFMIAFCAGAAACSAQQISSKDLVSRAKDFDNTAVVYRGEVVGDVMMRGAHAWINVNDGTHAIGVWITAAMAGDISRTGNFKQTGDTVEVTGIFHRACCEHGGDLDIHAQQMRVVVPGALRKTCGLNRIKKDWVIKLLGVVAIVWILTLLKIR